MQETLHQGAGIPSAEEKNRINKQHPTGSALGATPTSVTNQHKSKNHPKEAKTSRTKTI